MRWITGSLLMASDGGGSRSAPCLHQLYAHRLRYRVPTPVTAIADDWFRVEIAVPPMTKPRRTLVSCRSDRF